MNSLRKLLNDTGKKTLLGIFPHPDDETFASGGLFLEAKKMGWKTILICLTQGDAGKNSLKKSTENIKDIRKKELTEATQILNINKVYLLNFMDGKLKENENEWSDKLRDLIREISPSIIVSLDHSGITGHPDHIILSVKLLDIIRTSKSKPILLWSSPTRLNKLVNRSSKTKEFFSTPDLKLPLPLQATLNKYKAFTSHKSQIPSVMFKIGAFLLFILEHKELFHQVNLNEKYEYKFVDFEI